MASPCGCWALIGGAVCSCSDSVWDCFCSSPESPGSSNRHPRNRPCQLWRDWSACAWHPAIAPEGWLSGHMSRMVKQKPGPKLGRDSKRKFFDTMKQGGCPTTPVKSARCLRSQVSMPFSCAEGRVIYVGKAKSSVQNRLETYGRPTCHNKWIKLYFRGRKLAWSAGQRPHDLLLRILLDE